VVTWQLSQVFDDNICAAFLPVARVPLWQVTQLPLTALWSKRTFVQLVVTWQSSQVFDDGMWLAVLPVAVTPLWQLEQAPLTEA